MRERCACPMDLDTGKDQSTETDPCYCADKRKLTLQRSQVDLSRVRCLTFLFGPYYIYIFNDNETVSHFLTLSLFPFKFFLYSFLFFLLLVSPLRSRCIYSPLYIYDTHALLYEHLALYKSISLWILLVVKRVTLIRV